MPEDNHDIVSRLAPERTGGGTPGAAPGPRSAAGAPGGDLAVTPSVLRGAASAAHAIAETLTSPTDQAARHTRDAASALSGWRFGELLGAAVEPWHAEYRSVGHQVGLTGSMIADAARGFEWTEDRIVSTFASNES